VGAGEDRETDTVNVLGHGRGDDLLRGEPDALVDDLETSVPCPDGNLLGAVAVPVQAGFAHQQAQPPPAQGGLTQRGIGDDVKSYVDGLISDVGSKVSSFVNSGILDFPNGFPTGSQVEKSAGVSKTDLDAQPTQVLNLP